MPFPSLRHLLLPFFWEVRTHNPIQPTVPWEEHQVGVSDLVTYEVRFASLREMEIDNAKDAAYFVGIAINGRLNALLRVELQLSVYAGLLVGATYEGEPGQLAVVGALTAHLEVSPAPLCVLLR